MSITSLEECLMTSARSTILGYIVGRGTSTPSIQGSASPYGT